jgi:propionyl-CoA synthetase
MKGQLPFAFVTLSTTPPSNNHNNPNPNPQTPLFNSINTLIRSQIGPIASLGGMIQTSTSTSSGSGSSMIPKTRSGKTLRRVLRDLIENGVRAEYEREVSIPATIEDRDAVENARRLVREYFERRRGGGGDGGGYTGMKGKAKL